MLSKAIPIVRTMAKKRVIAELSTTTNSLLVDTQETVFIFGDSNTWGFNPKGLLDEPLRYCRNQRWTTLLQNQLNSSHGDKYVVEVDALNARTTVHDDKISPCDGQYNCNGRAILQTSLHSHKPISVVVLALGVNDLKTKFRASANDIYGGIRVLIKDILISTDIGVEQSNGTMRPPKLLIVGMPHVKDNHPVGKMWGFEDDCTLRCKKVSSFTKNAVEDASTLQRELLGRSSSSSSSEVEISFVDIGKVVTTSDIDGVHITLEDQPLVADAVHKALVQLLR